MTRLRVRKIQRMQDPALVLITLRCYQQSGEVHELHLVPIESVDFTENTVDVELLPSWMNCFFFIARGRLPSGAVLDFDKDDIVL